MAQKSITDRTMDRKKASSPGKGALDILGAVFGLIATVVAVLSYVQSQKSLAIALASEQRATRAEDLSRRVEAEQYLSDAWDLMGGDKGTSSIQRPIRDEKQLELARRLIVDKALVLQPASSEAHRYYAIYLYAKGDIRHAISELEQSLKLDPSSPEAKYDLTRMKLELYGTPKIP